MDPIPTHIALIMDGNRRYTKRHALHQDSTDPGSGRQVSLKSHMSNLQYFYEMGVKYVTVYAFTTDNFRREPHEVQALMDLMKGKIDELLTEGSLLKKFDARINFWGNLELLAKPVRLTAKMAMEVTVHNKGPVLSVCVVYTLTDEIRHAIEALVREKRGNVQIDVSDLERNMYTAGCVEPDIIILTSGKTCLSDFLLWQSDFTHLQIPNPLWHEFSLRHLVWTVLAYQKVHGYLKKWTGETEKNK